MAELARFAKYFDKAATDDTAALSYILAVADNAGREVTDESIAFAVRSILEVRKKTEGVAPPAYGIRCHAAALGFAPKGL